MHKLFIAALFATWSLTCPVAAQDVVTSVEETLDPTIDGGEDIVVSGERGEIHSQARQQARAITPRTATIATPIARMQTPVCPGVLGASEESAYQIIGRIRANADRIGHEAIRGEPCAPNVIVAFVQDPLADFIDMREHRHALVRDLDYWAAKRVREQASGSVLAWNVTSTRNRDGIASDGRPPTYATTSSGRTGLTTREDIEISVVLIRQDAVAMLDPIAVADYVTMRALAQTEPTQGTTQLGTILELFDDGVEAPPYRLTAFDEAYLTSLYRQPGNTPSRMALRDIGRLMERQGE